MKNIKLPLLILGMFLLQNIVKAQSPLWTLPSNIMNVSASPVPSISSLPTPTVGPYGGSVSWPEAYDGRDAKYTHNAMHDSNGELSFFMIDGYIFDEQGWLISREFAQNNIVGASDLYLVPMPSNCNKYYIFTTKAYPTIKETYYGLLDMSASSSETAPLGFLETQPTDMLHLLPESLWPMYKDVTKIDPSASIHSVVVAPTRNITDDRYVFINGDSRVFRFKITSTGLVYDNYDWTGFTGVFPPNPYSYQADFYLGNDKEASETELVLLPNGNYRMAFEMLLFADPLAGINGNSNYGHPSICIIDIDGSTMEFINPSAKYFIGPSSLVLHTRRYFSGLEFNRDGKFLYMSHSADNPQGSYLTVLNIPLNQMITPNLGQSSLADIAPYHESKLELGIDGKMYLMSSSNLASISNPDAPNSAVLNIEQAYSPSNVVDITNTAQAQKLYYLPSQIDTEDAFARFSSSCCKEVDAYVSTYTADHSSATWDLTSNPFNNATGTVRVGHKVVIPYGANILIKDMTFLFDEEASFIIEKGAKVTFDNTTLTSDACSGIMWQGVELHGDRNAGQYYANQGLLILKNGSVIENAYRGIATKKVTTSGWDWNSTGGIVRAKDSYFRNNKRDIEFLSYHFNPSSSNPTFESNNRSLFSNCRFSTTDDYVGTSLFPNATFWDVNGVTFNNGCVFEDTRTNLSGTRREGIISINASYSVSNATFENLEYGIKAFESDDFIGLNNGKHIRVFNSTFNCLRGIYFNGLDKSNVSENTFNTDDLGFSVSPSLYGMYLDFCKDYTIKENSFNNTSTKLHGAFTWGVIVANRSGEPTEIFKNTFNRHAIGIEAIDQNRTTISSTSMEGLEIRCNEFASTHIDIYVANSGAQPVPIKGINQNQGNPTVLNGLGLADNLFATSYVHSNFGNENEHISYFHHDPAQNSRLLPLTFNSSITPISSTVGSQTATCATNPFPIIYVGVIADVLGITFQMKSSLINAQNTYNSLVDGGETAQLEAEVITTTNETAYNNYMELMDKAGYLSEEVLLEVAKKEEGFTVAMIRNILVANPQSAKIKEIEDNLDSRVNLLPEYMRNQIRLGKTSLSTKEFLSLEISKYRKELDRAIQKGLEYIAYDTISYDSTDVVIDLISNTGLAKYELQKLKIYIAQGNKSQIDATLSILGSLKLSAQESNYVTDLVAYNDLKTQWADNSYAVHELPQVELDKLVELANANTLASANAHALLALNNQIDYKEPAYLPEMTKSFKLTTPIELIESDEFMLLYPNPTTDFVSVRYKYLEPYKNLILSVTDILGKQVYTKVLTEDENEIVVSLKDYTNGSYVVTISADEKVVYSDKVIKK